MRSHALPGAARRARPCSPGPSPSSAGFALLRRSAQPPAPQRCLPGATQLGLPAPSPPRAFSPGFCHASSLEPAGVCLPGSAAAAASVTAFRLSGPARAGPRSSRGRQAAPPIWKTGYPRHGLSPTLLAPAFSVPPPHPGVGRAAAFRLREELAISSTVLGVVGALAVSLSGFDPRDKLPYDRYRRSSREVPRLLPTLLIAHSGLNFLYTYVTGARRDGLAPEPAPRPGVAPSAARPGNPRDGEWPEPGTGSKGPAWILLDADYALASEDGWQGPARPRPRMTTT